MRNWFNIAVLLLLLPMQPLKLFGQTGDYFLANYVPTLQNIDNQNYAIVQDGLGQMTFANRKGLLKFDGNDWVLIKTPSSPVSLAVDHNENMLLVGCRGDFGFTANDSKGNEHYYSVSAMEHISVQGDVVSIKTTSNGLAFFLTNAGVLYEYSTKKKQLIKRWDDIGGELIANIVSYRDLFFAVTADGQFHKSEKSQFIPRGISVFDSTYVQFSTDFSEAYSIVGTSDNRLFSFDGWTFSPIKNKAQDYFDRSGISGAVALNDSLLAVSTYRNGCVILNVKTGEAESYVNQRTGLPDEEIFCIGTDKTGGLWVGHEYGFTRVDPNLPFRCYSNFPGLSGNINFAETFADKLYVSTNEGLYFIDEVRDYDEVEKLIKILQKEPDGNRQALKGQGLNLDAQKDDPSVQGGLEKPNGESEKEEKEEVQEKKKFLGIFNIFGKKKDKKKGKNTEPDEEKQPEKQSQPTLAENPNKEDDDVGESKPVESSPQKAKPRKKYQIVKTVETQLKSIKHLFRKVEGIDSKADQLLLFNDKLLVGTNNGLFQLDKDKKPEKIYPSPIGQLYVSAFHNRVYLTNADDRLKSMRLDEDGKWVVEEVFLSFGMGIYSLAEDSQGSLWAASVNEVFKIDFRKDGSILTSRDYEFENPYSDKLELCAYGDKMLIMLSSGIFSVDQATHALVKETALEQATAFNEHYKVEQPGLLWINNKKSWNLLSEKVKDAEDSDFIYLKLVNNIKTILYDKYQNVFWVVTNENKLYRFNHNKVSGYAGTHDLFLRSVKMPDGDQLAIEALHFDQTDNSVTFTFAYPYYLDNETVEFQYRLSGPPSLSKKGWSDWGRENIVSFNFLPSGNYTLNVRSRNTFGDMAEAEPVSFTINPPYWQTTWFFALQVMFFSTLLIVSYSVNRHGKSNMVIRKSLTYLTLILIAAYIETVAERQFDFTASPIFDFAIQVGLAMFIFPFERIMSNLMLRENKKKNLEKTAPSDGSKGKAVV